MQNEFVGGKKGAEGKGDILLLNPGHLACFFFFPASVSYLAWIPAGVYPALGCGAGMTGGIVRPCAICYPFDLAQDKFAIDYWLFFLRVPPCPSW